MSADDEAEAVIRRAYDAFNRKDIDGVLAAAHPDVDWTNLLDGGRVTGVSNVKAYWDRQFRVIDPQVDVLSMRRQPDGTVIAEVRHLAWFVSDGALALDEVLHHVFCVRDGLIRTWDVLDADGRPLRPPKPSDPGA